MIPQLFALFGNGSEMRRPGGPMDYPTLMTYAMAGILLAALVTAITKIRGIG